MIRYRKWGVLKSILRMEPTFQGNWTILIYISGCHSGKWKKMIFLKKKSRWNISTNICSQCTHQASSFGVSQPVACWDFFYFRHTVWSVLGGRGSEQSSTGGKCHMLSENVWFSWYKPSKYLILRERKKWWLTKRQTNKQNFLFLIWPLL